jgi:hypothetical protein
MRKGAFIVALAVVALLAMLQTQRSLMGRCDFEQKIITPDGMEFPLAGPRLAPGSPDLDWPLEGEGLPPIENLSQEVYGMPGALYKGTVVKPRVLTITAMEHGLTYGALMDMKARMQSALRWDRGELGAPSIYRFTMNGVSRDLCVHYDSAVERRVGRPGRVVVVAIRMIAYDPFWYDPETQEQVLDWADTKLVRLVMAKVDGVWDALGPPAAVAAGAGGNTHIQAVAVSPDGRYVYYGGDFQNFDNIPAADHIVRRDLTTDTWEAVGGGLNARVRVLTFAPDGRLYAGGYFTNGSGGAGDPLADYLAQYDQATDTWVNVGGGPGAGAVTTVLDIAFGHDGRMYVAGIFTNWGGTGANYIVSYTPAGGWAALGAAMPNTTVYAVVTMPDGHIVIGGDFTLIGAVAYLRVAEWDPAGAAYSTLGGGLAGPGTCYALCVGTDGKLYAGGVFPTAGGVIANNVACWNGASWSGMAGGFPTIGVVGASRLFPHPDGDIYASGDFQEAGGIPFANYVARWNGSAWLPLDIILPAPASAAPRFAFSPSGDLYLGTDALAVSIPCGAPNVLVNEGNAPAYPLIEIKNQGLFGLLINEGEGGSDDTKREIDGNMAMLDGEIVTMDLTSGVKSCESNWRGNRLGDILAASDMATFCLEASPRAAYGGMDGANLITAFLADLDGTFLYPRETGDNNNQLGAWEVLSGVSQENTNLGHIWVSIVADGGGFYHVEMFKDPAKGADDQVAHTNSYNAPCAVNVLPDNNSGLGFQIQITAVVGADTDIEVYFTIVTAFWRNRWWDLDAALTGAG